MIFNIKITKAGIERAIDFDALPIASQNFIIAYGARQLLNDATAPVNETTYPKPDERLAAAVAAVDKKFQRMLDGDLEIRESSGTRGDPVRTLAITLAVKFAPGKDAKTKRVNAVVMVDSSPKWLQLAKDTLEYAAIPEESEDLIPTEPIADAA